MKKILVSACLLGECCRYDGKSKPCADVLRLKAHYELLPICPEVMGGLPTPRTPSEIQGNRVMMKNGRDVTAHYRAGAERALQIARESGCDVAILKERSPSCGKGYVYSGRFDGTLVKGDGITAALLQKHGIRVLGESEIDQLSDYE